MAYQKQPLRARICAHCGDPYQAVDRRRLYCCPSCKTLASNARRKAPAGSAAAPISPSLAAPSAEASPRASLPFDAPTVGVVTAGTILGTYSVRALDKLLSGPAPAPRTRVPAVPAVVAAPVPVDPASWFPAAVLAAPAASILLPDPQGLPEQVWLQLDYFGRRFYYQPAQRSLRWECGPGLLWSLRHQAEFTRVFELSLPLLAPTGAPFSFKLLR